MGKVDPYKIDVPQAKLDKLQKWLSNYDEWPTEVEDADPWQYGSPV